MTRSTTELILGMGRDVEKVFGLSPRGLCRVDDYGWLGLTGETACADLNMAGLTKDAPASALDDYASEIEDRGLDAILIADDSSKTLSDAAAARGLTKVGEVPVMVWEGKPTPIPNDRYKVRLAGRSDQAAANRLAALAFSLDEEKVQRACPGDVQDAVDIWLVEDGTETLGCGWFVRMDDHVGIYTMSTPPEHQRKGVGRAVLDTAIAYYVGRGVTTFTLEATEAGYHLYEQLGFETVATPAVFVVGASTQFPG